MFIQVHSVHANKPRLLNIAEIADVTPTSRWWHDNTIDYFHVHADSEERACALICYQHCVGNEAVSIEVTESFDTVVAQLKQLGAYHPYRPDIDGEEPF